MATAIAAVARPPVEPDAPGRPAAGGGRRPRPRRPAARRRCWPSWPSSPPPPWSTPRRCGPIPGCRRRLGTILARGVPTPLVAETVGAGRGRVRLRQPVPPSSTSSRPRPTTGSTRSVTAHRRGRHPVADPAVRLTGPLGLGRWYHGGRDSHRGRRLPRSAGARRLAQAVRQGKLGRRGPAGPGAAGPRHRLRVGAGVRPRRRRPPHQLAGHGPAGSAHDQPVPRRPEPRRRLPGRHRPAHGRAPGRPQPPRRRPRRRGRRGRGGRRGRRPLRRGRLRHRDPAAKCGPGGAARGPSSRRRSTSNPRPVDSDYELAFTAVARSKRSFVLLITDLLEESAARPLLDAVPDPGPPPRRRRGHVADPDVGRPGEDAAGHTGRRLRRRRRPRCPRRPGGWCRPAWPGPAPRWSRPAPDAFSAACVSDLPQGEAPGPGVADRRLRGEPRLRRPAPSRAHASARSHRRRIARPPRRCRAGVTRPSVRPATTSQTRGAQHQLDRRPGLGDQRLAPRAPAGVDEGPAHAQAGGAGDDDARQLEHPVGDDQLDESRAVAGGRRRRRRPRRSAPR